MSPESIGFASLGFAPLLPWPWLVGGGVLWAAQAPVHGHFWTALAGPFFVAGAGTAFAFIPVSIAGLAGVAEREAGLASGLLNTSQQLGGAIGVAITSTVAATRLKTLAGQGKQVFETGVCITCRRGRNLCAALDFQRFGLQNDVATFC